MNCRVSTGPAGDLYLANSKSNTDSYIRFWLLLGFEGPPLGPPSIEGAYAAAVGDTDASLVAEINPHFFAGALGTTTYYLQYGTAACVKRRLGSGLRGREAGAAGGRAESRDRARRW